MMERLAFRPSKAEPTLLDMRVSKDSLSAGEKQLLALARAILRRTNVIIMDEATSQIDTDLDDKVRRKLPFAKRFSLADACYVAIDPENYPRGNGGVHCHHYRTPTEDSNGLRPNPRAKRRGDR